MIPPPPRSTLFPYTTLFRSSLDTVHFQFESTLRLKANQTIGKNGISHFVLSKDRKSTRLNSSHEWSSYAVFCLKKKKTIPTKTNNAGVTTGRQGQRKDDKAR